jgi:hypothetical protein
MQVATEGCPETCRACGDVCDKIFMPHDDHACWLHGTPPGLRGGVRPRTATIPKRQGADWMRLSDWDAAFAAGQRAERVRIHQLALTEAQRIRSANFSDLDGTWAGTLEDFADLLSIATCEKRQEVP